LIGGEPNNSTPGVVDFYALELSENLL
jgi:hypothetical protein